MSEEKYLLYLDECDCGMARAVLQRTDTIPILLRPKKAEKFLSKEYLRITDKCLTFVFDSDRVDDEVERFKMFCNVKKISVDFVGNDSEYYIVLTYFL